MIHFNLAKLQFTFGQNLVDQLFCTNDNNDPAREIMQVQSNQPITEYELTMATEHMKTRSRLFFTRMIVTGRRRDNKCSRQK
jgi:hypothetical protein